ncbi:MAG TPA: hypothetical protein VH681_13340 [Nitrospiraceae bacterium]
MTGLRRLSAVALAVASLAVLAGCSGMPPLAEQERKIRDNELTLRKLEPRAFVRAWGTPTYQHMEFMPFFGMKDGSKVPRSRLAVGASPSGWEADVDAGEGLFLAYPDKGWLVVFLDEIFVYREELTAEKLHELGRAWAHEDKFRTKIELEPHP